MAGMEMLLERVVPVAVAPVEPVAVVLVTAAASSAVVTAAAWRFP